MNVLDKLIIEVTNDGNMIKVTNRDNVDTIDFMISKLITTVSSGSYIDILQSVVYLGTVVFPTPNANYTSTALVDSIYVVSIRAINGVPIDVNTYQAAFVPITKGIDACEMAFIRSLLCEPDPCVNGVVDKDLRRQLKFRALHNILSCYIRGFIDEQATILVDGYLWTSWVAANKQLVFSIDVFNELISMCGDACSGTNYNKGCGCN